LVWPLLPKTLCFSKKISQSQPNHNPVIFPSLSIQRLQDCQTTLFCQFWHQHAITKIKGWVQIIGANIGSFAKSLCPYLWDIQMVVWTKQFVLYIVPG
jgi:hypothetical protein